jgi:hypothetical protein
MPASAQSSKRFLRHRQVTKPRAQSGKEPGDFLEIRHRRLRVAGAPQEPAKQDLGHIEVHPRSPAAANST